MTCRPRGALGGVLEVLDGLVRIVLKLFEQNLGGLLTEERAFTLGTPHTRLDAFTGEDRTLSDGLRLGERDGQP